MVARADGAHVRMDAVREGDVILAVTATGALTTDSISLFSLADSSAFAEFVVLHTENTSLALTPTHHVPVGSECCTTLKQALEVQLGETLWVVGASANELRSHAVTNVGYERRRGLHSPLLTQGTFPVVDGFVTSFNSRTIVAIDGAVLPYALPMCKATGTCDLLRRSIALAECALKRVTFGPSAICKTSKYLDGLIVDPAGAIVQAQRLELAVAQGTSQL